MFNHAINISYIAYKKRPQLYICYLSVYPLEILTVIVDMFIQ